jgi:hypothetical protein
VQGKERKSNSELNRRLRALHSPSGLLLGTLISSPKVALMLSPLVMLSLLNFITIHYITLNLFRNVNLDEWSLASLLFLSVYRKRRYSTPPRRSILSQMQIPFMLVSGFFINLESIPSYLVKEHMAHPCSRRHFCFCFYSLYISRSFTPSPGHSCPLELSLWSCSSSVSNCTLHTMCSNGLRLSAPTSTFSAHW